MPEDRRRPSGPHVGDSGSNLDSFRDVPVDRKQPSQRHPTSESTDSGYSSYHFSSEGSSAAVTPSAGLPRIQGAVDRGQRRRDRRNRVQSGSEEACWNPDCHEPNCLRGRMIYETRPGLHRVQFPPSASHPLPGPPNPFTPLGGLAFNSPHLDYGRPVVPSQPPPMAYAQYTAEYSARPSYIPPAYRQTGYDGFARHSHGFDPISSAPAPLPPNQFHTQTYPDRGEIWTNQMPLERNLYSPELPRSPHDTWLGPSLARDPGQVPRREHRHVSRKDLPKHVPKKTREQQVRSEETRYDSRQSPSPSVSTHETPTFGGTDIGSQSKVASAEPLEPNLGAVPKGALSKSEIQETRVDKAAKSTDSVPPPTSYESNGTGSVKEMRDPSPKTEQPQFDSEDALAADSAVDAANSKDQDKYIVEPEKTNGDIIEDLPQPHLLKIEETEECDLESGPEGYDDPTGSFPRDIEDLAKELSLSGSSSDPQAPDCSSVKRTRKVFSAALTPTAQDQNSTNRSTGPSLEECPVTDMSLPRLAGNANEDVDKGSNVKQNAQRAIAVWFSEAIIRHCGSIRELSDQSFQSLQMGANVSSLLDTYLRLALGSVTSNEETYAVCAVSDHRR